MNKEEQQKRGWVFDAIIQIGNIEAGMSHGDEEICNLQHDSQSTNGSVEEVQKIMDALAMNHDMLSIDYEDRVALENFVFEFIPESNRHYWCRVKHAATSFVVACENYHASGMRPELEDHMVRRSKVLAMACSMAFNMEVLDCLRCLSDSLSKRPEPKLKEASKATKKVEKI